MKTQKLYEILEKTTKVYRKGASIEERTARNLKIVEMFGYPHTSTSNATQEYDKVDMIFVDIAVNIPLARQYKSEFEAILADYPEPNRLAGGPSYIELAPNFEVQQEEALRLMALGKTLGLWEIMSGKTLGLGDAEARELAGKGFLMISGYKSKNKNGDR